MNPTTEERLARIREVSDRALHYYASAYLRTDPGREHVIAERDLLMAHMREIANVVALLEGDDLSDRTMMSLRHEVVDRHIDLARENPWTPPSATT